MGYKAGLSCVRALPFLAVGLVLVGLLTGCGKDDDEPKVLARTGRVASINNDTGAVEMWTYVPKYKKEIKIEGTLAPDAEILINGSVANLEDVRIDDQVMVYGEAVRVDGEYKFTAKKVEVTRPVETTGPATDPPVNESQ